MARIQLDIGSNTPHLSILYITVVKIRHCYFADRTTKVSHRRHVRNCGRSDNLYEHSSHVFTYNLTGAEVCVVDVMNRLRVGQARNRGWIPGLGKRFRLAGWITGESWFDLWRGQEIFQFLEAARPPLRPAQPPVEWLPGTLARR